jgi:hypothetical protein
MATLFPHLLLLLHAPYLMYRIMMRKFSRSSRNSERSLRPWKRGMGCGVKSCLLHPFSAHVTAATSHLSLEDVVVRVEEAVVHAEEVLVSGGEWGTGWGAGPNPPPPPPLTHLASDASPPSGLSQWKTYSVSEARWAQSG